MPPFNLVFTLTVLFLTIYYVSLYLKSVKEKQKVPVTPFGPEPRDARSIAEEKLSSDVEPL